MPRRQVDNLKVDIGLNNMRVKMIFSSGIMFSSALSSVVKTASWPDDALPQDDERSSTGKAVSLDLHQKRI